MNADGAYYCDKCDKLTMVEQIVKADDYQLCTNCFDNLDDTTGYCSMQCMVTGSCDHSC